MTDSRPLISLLMPTRGRVDMAKRFFNSVLDTAKHPEAIEVILYVDEDDVESHTLDQFEGLTVRKVIGLRKTMGHYNTTCLQASKGDIIVLANDDMVIRTPGWDERLREVDAQYPDKIYLAYANDLFKGEHLSTFPILSRLCCDLIGNPYPLEYKAGWIDYHLMDIFKRLDQAGLKRMQYLPEVIFEHLHVRAGKAEMDATYRQVERFAHDHVFLELIPQRRAAAERLISVIRGQRTPVPTPAPLSLVEPFQHALRAFWLMTKLLLLDTTLPLRWRGWLWIWFMGRYAAGKGLLKPFVQP